jgi:hypothetical protein
LIKRRQLIQTSMAAAVGALIRRPNVYAQEPAAIYLHPVTGGDSNSGTKDSPLRTLAAAARRVNASTGTGPIAIILSEGVYAVGEPALFKPAGRSFTRDSRLTIRAEVLPDDPGWSPQNMPVLIHTMALSPNWMGRPDPFGGVNYGMQFEASHVTVRGLKILGTPHLERATEKSIRRVYPIAREGAEWDDLEIKQCLFTGNREVAEVHCAILARGNGVAIDHCVFYGCKVAAVYWSGQAKACAMRNTLVYGSYVTGPWLCAIADDFDFQHNVISSSFSALLFQGAVRKYNLANSFFAGNKNVYGAGFGPTVNFKPLGTSVLELPPSSKVVDKPVEIELDQAKRGYLHIVAGTPGAGLAAGLFTRRL